MKFTKTNFFEITKHTALYSIMPIKNIPSVLQYGILSHDRAAELPHTSVALEDVQKKRDVKIVNANRGLHSYANLYFDPYNPMLSRLREDNNIICILAISPEVLNIPDVVVTDRNAAKKIVQFVEPEQMTEVLDFDTIYMRYWVNKEDKLKEESNKAIKCAEVLVPDQISPDYILGAVVANNSVKQKLKEMGFDKCIIIDSNRFF